MDRRTVGLAEAKAHLSELTDLAARGEEIVITKRGRAVAVLSPVRAPFRPLDLDAARALVRRLPRQPEPASEQVRRLRDEERY
jgi:prevent-host-death family protein